MKNKNSQMIKSKIDNNAQNRRDYDDEDYDDYDDDYKRSSRHSFQRSRY